MMRRWDKRKPSDVNVAVQANNTLVHKQHAAGYVDWTPPAPLTQQYSVQQQQQQQQQQQLPGSGKQHRVLSGNRVLLRDGRQGEVDFVATSGEALVALDDGQAKPRPQLEETQRTWVEGLWPEQCWARPSELRITERKHRLRERRDVADYRHALRCLGGRQEGLSVQQLALELGRPEGWIQEACQRSAAPSKPRNLEHWDAAGFCEVRYVKGLYHEAGLYEKIVQGVDWQQDRVWRVHKETDGQWGLRTVKQCQAPGCGRSLLRVPETAVKIGPRDSAAPVRTKPHSNWRCSRQGSACMKPAVEAPLGDAFYWWCPAHKWYVCQECHQDIEDKPTSKQIRHWYYTECPELDNLVYRVVRDFNLPDPQAVPGDTARYTIKMNWYPDGLAQVTDHRHDVWTILVSLGAPRVLNVDYARVLMEDGDAILFGTQRHGVPPGPPSQGGRLSLVFMFQPDKQIESAALHLAGQTPAGFVARPVGQPAVDLEPEAVDDEQVYALCAALGVSEQEAANALIACGGDAEVAAEMLLGAA
eukprot:TRINITY_DN10099_c1_g2_i1.p1 TRINITY_DN10099_c1_g2~~TRINITY_DN10099_c1_g2_i1.p1  ORF type:complete len:530 (+),score=83.22 TRINITY_DN10099_c1_g2_i1:124-1713(+)